MHPENFSQSSSPSPERTDSVPPLLGVVLTNFNHREYLEQALRSILDQSFSDFCLGIIDDASTDGSWGIISRVLRDYGNSKIFFLEQNTSRQGVCRNRNRVFAQCPAKYFLYLDADDFFSPGFFEKLAAELKHRKYPDLLQFLEIKLDCQTGKTKVDGKNIQSVDQLMIPYGTGFNYVYSSNGFRLVDGFDEKNFSQAWGDWDFVFRLSSQVG